MAFARCYSPVLTALHKLPGTERILVVFREDLRDTEPPVRVILTVDDCSTWDDIEANYAREIHSLLRLAQQTNGRLTPMVMTKALLAVGDIRTGSWAQSRHAARLRRALASHAHPLRSLQ